MDSEEFPEADQTEYLKRFIRSVCKERHGEASFYQRVEGDAAVDQTLPVQIPPVSHAQKVCVDLGVHEPGG